MLPAFTTVNVKVPAAMVGADSSTFHSDSLASSGDDVPGVAACGRQGDRETANRRAGNGHVGYGLHGLICDLPGLSVYQQMGSLRETPRTAGIIHRE